MSCRDPAAAVAQLLEALLDARVKLVGALIDRSRRRTRWRSRPHRRDRSRLAVTETMLLSATGVTSTWASRSSGEPDASGTPSRLCWARRATSVVLIRRATVSTARSGSTELGEQPDADQRPPRTRTPASPGSPPRTRRPCRRLEHVDDRGPRRQDDGEQDQPATLAQRAQVAAQAAILRARVQPVGVAGGSCISRSASARRWWARIVTAHPASAAGRSRCTRSGTPAAERPRTDGPLGCAPVRVAVFTDYVYHQRDGELYAERAFALFLARLGGRCSIGWSWSAASAPGPSRRQYALPSEVEFVGLPYYASLGPATALRALGGAMRRFWRALDEVDCVWLLGPHPFACRSPRSRGLRRRRVVLGVRQDFRAYIASRHPGQAGRGSWRPWSLEGSFRLLARRCAVVAVGPDLAAPVPPRPDAARDQRLAGRPRTRSSTRDADGRSYDGELRLISVGRLEAEKNPLLLAEVLALLARDGRDWSLRVCGEGELAGALEARLAELGVADRARAARLRALRRAARRALPRQPRAPARLLDRGAAAGAARGLRGGDPGRRHRRRRRRRERSPARLCWSRRATPRPPPRRSARWSTTPLCASACGRPHTATRSRIRPRPRPLRWPSSCGAAVG